MPWPGSSTPATPRLTIGGRTTAEAPASIASPLTGQQVVLSTCSTSSRASTGPGHDRGRRPGHHHSAAVRRVPSAASLKGPTRAHPGQEASGRAKDPPSQSRPAEEGRGAVHGQEAVNQTYRKVYLRSSRWESFRRGWFTRHGGWCRACGSTGRLDLHHLTY